MTGVVAEFATTILAAGATTLLLGLASLLLAVILGLAAAFAKLSRSRVLRRAAALYTFIVRGIPDLVVMLLVYYSVPALLNQAIDALEWDMRIEFSPIVAGIAAIYTIFMILAGGLKFLLLSALLYAPGSVLYFWARREQGRSFFTGWELTVFIVASIGAVAAIVGLVSGWITI